MDPRPDARPGGVADQPDQPEPPWRVCRRLLVLDPYADGHAAYVLMQRGGEDAALRMKAARDARRQLDADLMARLLDRADEERVFAFQAARAKLPCVGLRATDAPEPPPTRVTLAFGWGMR